MTSFQTLDYLCRKAALGKREDFEKFLNLVPDVRAQAGDELSAWRSAFAKAGITFLKR